MMETLNRMIEDRKYIGLFLPNNQDRVVLSRYNLCSCYPRLSIFEEECKIFCKFFVRVQRYILAHKEDIPIVLGLKSKLGNAMYTINTDSLEG